MPSGNQDSPPGVHRNAAGSPPPKGATEVTGRSFGAAERWGRLPEKHRAIFTARDDADLPAAYRDWIDAYYERLITKRR